MFKLQTPPANEGLPTQEWPWLAYEEEQERFSLDNQDAARLDSFQGFQTIFSQAALRLFSFLQEAEQTSCILHSIR